MAISVNTNVASLNAQRNLGVNSTALNNTLKRLSSGLRINSASDDAAGLAIATGFESQVRGLNQAARNANDGLSLLGTAESAISEQGNLLQRMRELAVQSASDTNSGLNRAALNDEITQLKTEFDRIAKTVKFNGQSLLDGTFTSKDIQVGADSDINQKIGVDLQSTRSSAIGKNYSATSTAGVAVTGATAGQIKITVDGTDYSVGATASDGASTASPAGSAIAYANAINALSGDTGVVASAEATTFTGNGAQTAASIASNDVKVNGVDIGAVTLTGATDAGIVNAINAKQAETGVTAALDGSNKIVLTAADGRNIELETTAAGNTASGLQASATTSTTSAKVKLTSYKGAFSVTDASTKLNITGAAAQGSDSVATVSVTSKTNAKNAIDIIDGSLQQLNNRRAAIGANVNRLTSVTSSLQAMSENMAASRSRIMDADFASETANMTRSQILQQATVSVLAQANQAPQIALSLLR